MEQGTGCRTSKWRDEGKAFSEIRSDFEEKAAFFGVLLLQAHPQRDQ
jgi:hypothetical protein